MHFIQELKFCRLTLGLVEKLPVSNYTGMS